MEKVPHWEVQYRRCVLRRGGATMSAFSPGAQYSVWTLQWPSEEERASASTQHRGEAVDEASGERSHEAACKVETLSPLEGNTGRHVNDLQTGSESKELHSGSGRDVNLTGSRMALLGPLHPSWQAPV